MMKRKFLIGKKKNYYKFIEMNHWTFFQPLYSIETQISNEVYTIMIDINTFAYINVNYYFDYSLVVLWTQIKIKFWTSIFWIWISTPTNQIPTYNRFAMQKNI